MWQQRLTDRPQRDHALPRTQDGGDQLDVEGTLAEDLSGNRSALRFVVTLLSY